MTIVLLGSEVLINSFSVQKQWNTSSADPIKALVSGKSSIVGKNEWLRLSEPNEQ